MNKKDILKLSQKTEEEQLLILQGAGIRQTRRGDSYDMDYIDMWESLADLADRLWETNCIHGNWDDTLRAMRQVANSVECESGKELDWDNLSLFRWFLFDAPNKPLCKIQAALLAKEGV